MCVCVCVCVFVCVFVCFLCAFVCVNVDVDVVHTDKINLNVKTTTSVESLAYFLFTDCTSFSD